MRKLLLHKNTPAHTEAVYTNVTKSENSPRRKSFAKIWLQELGRINVAGIFYCKQKLKSTIFVENFSVVFENFTAKQHMTSSFSNSWEEAFASLPRTLLTPMATTETDFRIVPLLIPLTGEVLRKEADYMRLSGDLQEYRRQGNKSAVKQYQVSGICRTQAVREVSYFVF